MKGFTYKESIDRLEKEIKNASGGGGGGGTAADVSYDNTSSGLTAGTVQAAIDEIDGSVDTLSGTVNTLSGDVNTLKEGEIYSADETICGKIGNDILYRKVISCGALPNATTKKTAHNITGLKKCYNISAVATATTAGVSIPIPMLLSTSSVANTIMLTIDATDISIITGYDATVYDDTTVILEYTKTAPANNTRTKKK